MFWWIIWLGCHWGASPDLGVEGRAARDALKVALVERDVGLVADAARSAGPWEGKDVSLDRLLGDALANVLMRPEEGLSLLDAHSALGDTDWERSVLDAVFRTGDIERIAASRSRLGRPAIPLEHPVVQQMVLRARSDPAVGHSALEQAVADCSLLDGQPQIGRQVIDLPGPSQLPSAATALGATHFVIGRPAWRSDPDPVTGRGPVQCATGAVISGGWPVPAPRSMVIGASDGRRAVYINLHPKGGGIWAYAASDSEAAAQWIQAALYMAEHPDAADLIATVRARFGTVWYLEETP